MFWSGFMFLLSNTCEKRAKKEWCWNWPVFKEKYNFKRQIIIKIFKKLPEESLLLVLKEFCRILAGAVRLDCFSKFLTVKGRSRDIEAAAGLPDWKSITGLLSPALTLLKASRAAFIFAWVFSNFLMFASMSELGTRPSWSWPRPLRPSRPARPEPMAFSGGGVAWAGRVLERCRRLLKIDSAWWRL